MKLTLGIIAPVFVMLLCSQNIFGQTEVQLELSPIQNQQLIEIFGQDWVNQNNVMVHALEDCRVNRISYKESLLTVDEKYPLLSSYPLMNKFNPGLQAPDFSQFTPDTFNPFTYSLEFLSDKIQVIRIDGTDFLMIIQPVKRN